MILEMKVPSPGESISEVEIAQWLVENGDFVEKDQTIAEVDSDKATLDLPAQESGIITLKAEEGDTVFVGDIVCTIDTTAKKVSEEIKVDSNDRSNLVKEIIENKFEKKEITKIIDAPSPAAKKILKEKGIKSENIIGTGKNGRISKEDALKALPKVDIDSVSKNRI